MLSGESLCGRTRDTGNQAAVVNRGRRGTCVLSLDPWIEKPIINTSLTSLGETACPESKYLWNTKETVAGKQLLVYPFRARSPFGGTVWMAQAPRLRP